MDSIIDVLSELQRGGASDALAKQLGAETGATRNALSAALPVLVSGLARNAQQPGGAEALLGALDRDHDGSILDDLVGSLGGALGGGAARPKALDGEGILGHIFGGRRRELEAQIGQRTGLDAATVARLLAMLAPLVMGALGRARQKGQIDAGGLRERLESERRQAETAMPGGFGGLESIFGGIGTPGSRAPRDAAPPASGSVLGRLGGGLLRRWLSRRGR